MRIYISVYGYGLGRGILVNAIPKKAGKFNTPPKKNQK